MNDHNPIPERFRLPNLLGRLFHTQPPTSAPPAVTQPDTGFGRYSLPNLVGRLFHHDQGNNAGHYGGSFFDGGAGSTSGMGGFNGSNYGSQYGGSNTFGGQFGTGYGYANGMFTNNPSNVGPFGPATPSQVGPFGNNQQAPQGQGGGDGHGSGQNVGSGSTGMGKTGNSLNTALYGWGVNRGPNYS